MEKIRIKGGKSLSGRLHLFGAKNAALPLMASSLLTKATLTLNNLPNLVDINTMKNLLMHHGVKVNSPKGNSDGNTIKRTLNLSIIFARPLAYCLDSNSFIGTVTNSGSP